MTVLQPIADPAQGDNEASAQVGSHLPSPHLFGASARPERTAGPHAFWMATCGLDTYRRSNHHARLDTPWNAFTADNQGLVCTLWTDLIVEIPDAKESRTRRFVKIGGNSKKWQGVARMHGKEARANLERAIQLKLPVFGYEAEPDAAKLKNGERSVKRFYLDSARELKAWIGLGLHALDERLHIEDAFRAHDLANGREPSAQAKLFELVDGTDDASKGAGLKDAPPQIPTEEDEVGQGFEGNLSAVAYARMALPMLIAHVLDQTDNVLVPLTYLDVATFLGRRNKHGNPWARGLGHVLDHVTTFLNGTSTQTTEAPPFLSSIVVLSSGPNAGLPDDGVRDQWPGYASLSRVDKQARVAAEYQRILQFGSRWNEVLRLLGLPPVVPPSRQQDPLGSGHPGWGGGESDAHKQLKRHVRDHPEIVGAAAGWFAQEEYLLRSGDEIDVMFKSDRVWIGVEVKSRVSDRLISDYERGLYQVVKYRAVLEAQARIDHPDQPPAVRVFLALETALPEIHRGLADVLDVECVERIAMSDELLIE